MKIDISKAEREAFDHCVMGSGPAGVIVALELARANKDIKILLVEYGLPGQPLKNDLDDSIQISNLKNHHDPYECTNKGFGGSSATWGGRCVMYDEVDFLPRKIIGDDCTWDLSLFSEVGAFVPRTSAYFECGSGSFDLESSAGYRDTRISERFVKGDVTDTAVERWSMPTRFGTRYADEMESLPNLFLLEGFELRELPTEEGKVQNATVRSVTSKTNHLIKASNYVLAAGTQETTRILLRNPTVFEALNGPPGSLGRYYQGHVSGKIASVRFTGDPKKTDYGFIREADGTFIRRRFQFSTEVLCRLNLLNTAIWLDNPLYFDPKHRSGAMSFMYLAMITPILGKKLAPPAIAHSVTKGKVTGIWSHVANILRGLPGSLVTPALTFYGRYCVKRKLPGVFLYSPENKYALHFHAEQIPDPDNRMRLDDDGETLIIDYRLTNSDVDSVIRCHELLDAELRRQGCGELEYWFDKDDLPAAIQEMSKDGIHQSGTTRIADSPEKGVLDRNLKVWGTENLYVCSASAFPTSGQANPTYFLGAFAVRLAHHLLGKS